jgi:hypothetical protein
MRHRFTSASRWVTATEHVAITRQALSEIPFMSPAPNSRQSSPQLSCQHPNCCATPQRPERNTRASTVSITTGETDVACGSVRARRSFE